MTAAASAATPAPPDEAAVTRAIAAGEIVPWFQPIVDLVGGRVVALEALARWARPGSPVQTPEAIIRVAERTETIVDLDRAVATRALVALAGWQQRHPTLRLNLNLSGRSLDRSDWVSALRDVVARTGVRAGTVDVELTETVRPRDLRATADLLRQAQRAGFAVWLDDLGSGWSTLADLDRLAVDGFKIDRSVAATLGEPATDTRIQTMTAAAGTRGRRVTIEGIETAGQAVRAAGLGCHYGQGYLWSRAVPADEVPALLTRLG